MAAQMMDATLQSLSANSTFRQACSMVQGLRYNTALRAELSGVGPFELVNLDMSQRVTAKETPFEEALRRAVSALPEGGSSELYKKTVAAHEADANMEAFIDMYKTVGVDTLNVAGDRRGSSFAESLYLALSYLKFVVYGETNHVTRALVQRVHTYLFMHVAATFLTFTKSGEMVQATEGEAPSPDVTPLFDLLESSKKLANDETNPVLNRVRVMDTPGLANKSSSLSALVQKQQMSLNRALTSIGDARRQLTDEVRQTFGFGFLLVVCLGVFYGWMKFRPALWARMRVPMAVTATVTALIVLGVTGIAIIKPVESFEQFYAEEFCTAAGQCEGAMTTWAAEASKQAYVSTLDSTADITKRELVTRNESLEADLAAVSQRVNATDIEYRSQLFAFNRMRQAKRFVVMVTAIALMLMVFTIMGLPAQQALALHVIAGVVVLIVATLVYRGNAQRSRARWTQIYWPGPEDV